jgi:two-component system cell cycle sensor histidine kinase/response regulator CckA
VGVHSETLLVVDDEPGIRGLLQDGLRAMGFNVLVASNGAEGLRVAEEYGRPIRLLITDVIMPQMSGPELARSLRSIRDTDVIYMTGYADDKLDDITESGELTLIRKPFHLDELLARVSQIIARKSGAAEG